MGCKLKSDLVKNVWVPGAGTYDQSTEKLKQSAPKFGFGSSTRPDITNKKLNTPGPGSYKAPYAIGSRWDTVN